jgi:hypothetical protein
MDRLIPPKILWEKYEKYIGYATKTPSKSNRKNKEKMIWHIRPSLKQNSLRI